MVWNRTKSRNPHLLLNCEGFAWRWKTSLLFIFRIIMGNACTGGSKEEQEAIKRSREIDNVSLPSPFYSLSC